MAELETRSKTGIGEMYGMPKPKPLKIKSSPIQNTKTGIACCIFFLKVPLVKFPKYTTEVIKGMVPKPKRNM